MNNFGRALRLSLQDSYTLAASVACAVAVAVFWGGNISAVYPLVEVTTKGRSLQEWAAEGIKNTSDRAAELRAELACQNRWGKRRCEAPRGADRFTLRAGSV